METNILKATIVSKLLLGSDNEKYEVSLDINPGIKASINDLTQLESRIIYAIDMYIRTHSAMEIPAILTSYIGIQFEFDKDSKRRILLEIGSHMSAINLLNRVVTDNINPSLRVEVDNKYCYITPTIEELTEVLEKEHQRRIRIIQQLKRTLIDPSNTHKYQIMTVEKLFEEHYLEEYTSIMNPKEVLSE